MGKETEVKFQCAPQVVAELSRIHELTPLYRLSPPRFSEIHDTYFDTEDLLLLQSSASLRCRKKGSELKVTFKSNARVNGSSVTRDEIEQTVDEKIFQALLHKGKPASFVMPALRRLIGGRSLKPVLEVENRRQIREIRRTERALIAELSLDEVRFLRHGYGADFHGLEVESKSTGTAEDLAQISQILHTYFPAIQVDHESKYEKGMRMLI